jgi:hypothetical protein
MVGTWGGFAAPEGVAPGVGSFPTGGRGPSRCMQESSHGGKQPSAACVRGTGGDAKRSALLRPGPDGGLGCAPTHHHLVGFAARTEFGVPPGSGKSHVVGGGLYILRALHEALGGAPHHHPLAGFSTRSNVGVPQGSGKNPVEGGGGLIPQGKGFSP